MLGLEDIRGFPRWVMYNVEFSDLATASTTNSFVLFTQAGGPGKGKQFIHSAFIKSRTAFQGGAIATYSVTVGNVGDNSVLITAYNAKSAANNNAGISPLTIPYYVTTSRDIEIYATSTGANLDAATQGHLEVWVLISELP